MTHRVEGKAHVYRARQQPSNPAVGVLGQLIKQVFGGSAASLVLHLVDTGDLTEDDLREVRQQIAARARPAKALRPKPKEEERDDCALQLSYRNCRTRRGVADGMELAGINLTACAWLVLKVWRTKSPSLRYIKFGCLGLSRSHCSRWAQLSPDNFPRYSGKPLH